MRAPWFGGAAISFDLETTGPDPLEARIVTATAVRVTSLGVGEKHEWLVNPGVEIPAEAIAIHGVTNELVQTKGIPIADAVPDILAVFERAWAHGLPLIAFNANYDLTVLEEELQRLHPSDKQIMLIGDILDPFVIDRGCDPFRKGKRTLTQMAAHYAVRQEAAHTSTGDSLAAARIVWAQSKLAMRPGRFAKLGPMTIDQMQTWQAKAHFDRQTNYEQYLAKQGKPQVIEKSWPIRGRAA